MPFPRAAAAERALVRLAHRGFLAMQILPAATARETAPPCPRSTHPSGIFLSSPLTPIAAVTRRERLGGPAVGGGWGLCVSVGAVE